jgi:hypothetical protein
MASPAVESTKLAFFVLSLLVYAIALSNVKPFANNIVNNAEISMITFLSIVACLINMFSDNTPEKAQDRVYEANDYTVIAFIIIWIVVA